MTQLVARTLVELLHARAERTPDRVAYRFLIDGERQEATFTYAQLDERARAVASRLQELGATGERVLLLFPPGLDYIAAFFGCLYAGAVAVPAYPPAPGRGERRLGRLRTIVADAKPKVALTTRTLLGATPILFADAPEFARMQWEAADAPDGASGWAAPRVSEDSLAFLQYTSGSTAAPKGVMLTHGNLLHNSRLIHRGFGNHEDRHTVLWLPLYHDMGLIGGVLQPLYSGFCATLMSPTDFLQRPLRWLDAISRLGGRSAGGPNFAFDLCAQKVTDEMKATLDLSTWEVAFTGAEPIRADTLARFAKAFAPCGFRREAFFPCYGLAEGTLFVSGGPARSLPAVRSVQADALQHGRVSSAFPGEDGARVLTGCGVPSPEQRVEIVRPQTGEVCANDEIGEIWVSGGSVAQGYWNNPALTESTFRAHLANDPHTPFLRTGDLGFVQDGQLFVTGRMKDVVIIRGRNHYPQDIEQTVEHAGKHVRPGCSAAFSLDVRGEERLAVIAEVDRHAPRGELGDVIARVRRAIAEEHGLPVYAVTLVAFGSVPKTSSGKIQRHACKAAFQDARLRVVEQWLENDPGGPEDGPREAATPAPDAPSDESDTAFLARLEQADLAEARALVDEALRSTIARLLNTPAHRVTVTEPLTALGLDSLQSMELKAKLERTFGVTFSLEAFVDGPTIAGLREVILLERERTQAERRPKLQVALAATFTAEPVSDAFTHWLSHVGMPTEVRFAPYGQVFQELLDPRGTLGRNAGGVNIVLVRVADWMRGEEFTREGRDRVRDATAEFVRALRVATTRVNARFLVGLCPSVAGDETPEHLAFLESVTEQLGHEIDAIPGVIAVPAVQAARRYGVRDVYDERGDTLGHMPFTREYYAALGTQLARTVSATQREACKVIVVDCDNTLWSGVVGEDGPRGVQFAEPYLALQRFLVEQQARGALVALCSKNAEADVLAVFRERADEMPLALRHVVAHRVNWQRKSENLESLAAELNLGLDSFVFIDDNPLEVAEVQAALPDVLCVTLPSRPHDIPAFLEHHWAFDRVTVTAEDRARTESYRQNRQRAAVEARSVTLDDFLAALDLRVRVAPVVAGELERVAQLTQKTNQFNTTTRRRRLPDLQALLDGGWQCFSVHVSDRFGDYGLVGAATVHAEGPCLTVDSLLLSCRVLGKRVEHALVQHLAEYAARHGHQALRLEFRASDRNTPARAFLESLGAAGRDENGDGFTLTLPVHEVEARLAAPEGETPSPSPEARPPVRTRHVRTGDAGLWTDVARHTRSAQSILAAIGTRKRARPALSSPYVAPRSPLQQDLTAGWSELLRVEPVGLYDSFFDLGGDSLRSAALSARISRDHGVDLSLAQLASPTVAELARAITDLQAGRSLTPSAALASLEGEVTLDPAIVARPDAPPRLGDARHALLTGATGYFGAFLLRELLDGTSLTVSCLVRADSEAEGLRRVRRNLETHGLWQHEDAARIRAVPGDLAQPHLGVGVKRFEALAKEIDVIYHNGAWVNFVYPYEVLRGANVRGTEEVLRLAAHGHVKPVHFISTLGALMSSAYPAGQRVSEDAPLEHCTWLANGYEQSKWVADRMVQHARERGIPTAIYRVGMLTGDSRTGVYNKTDEFLTAMIKGCIQLQAIPDLDTEVELVPIDYVSRAVVHISKQPGALGKAFHIKHPDEVRAAEITRFIRQAGYPLRVVSFDDWKQELLAGLGRRDNALYPYSDFLKALHEQQCRMPDLDTANTSTFLADSGIACPNPQALLSAYFRYFVHSGFLPAARPEAVLA
ncbi:thioester reductase domain-containing protein [Deinococcus yavapaiensis]|uniref:HAD superfamily phosphatase (TIGR01681 family)/FkbH-like protein/thioester reductase-like protein n=1 Tax=Deinococcus yavapaiensis KR-236 TaxID=694435 RepID=A0A318S811_9DEIO|nr:thioester reductase domain-containing protein [Deinococcus yavapaiensis]PYE55196.1 HAD superfamily phosphatase (TIGR01681 family)/FkbH-like protein/thioester reductase-like protein [Deinococcus yavapaiensis KR-236]